ncbi:hypothetical protein STM14_2651 [Salmonella enterica subsp. enterica serovar Typhimurium str. 14028S]|uniref:Uncharacterized protein n=2 Tax=Salmonella enterica I TaxID=59201 RepID=A0A0F6B3K4_SALT1|nr:hypothetical protein SPAB_00873 [Salmonella enterica subsp. enterica serovar Paratyphi B str. SPB7]ACY89094.1 hypothetical protein STM14_2651 [Salmonella enterica subsp. enterica serovar Typhimurium str. 14028S]
MNFRSLTIISDRDDNLSAINFNVVCGSFKRARSRANRVVKAVNKKGSLKGIE